MVGHIYSGAYYVIAEGFYHVLCECAFGTFRFSLPPLSLLRGWFLRGLPYLDLTTPRATYVMRSILAAGMALVVAYMLDLRAPYSAASSVLLVINPVQGAVIGKGVWRILGTLVGMLASFILMSLFGQSPWLFLLGFGLWMGVCVVGMTLLRHFRAYGATLAGYIPWGWRPMEPWSNLDFTFLQVVGRGASVSIGVVCLVCVCRTRHPGRKKSFRRNCGGWQRPPQASLSTNHQATHTGETRNQASGCGQAQSH